MIRKYNEYINEDYFSKLASRKDTGVARKEQTIDEDFVRSYAINCGKVSFRIENGKTVVDIDGGYIFGSFELDKLPFRFGKVTGDFDCSETGLQTLEGCPEEVGGTFFVEMNSLTSLEGGPKKVGGDYRCAGNQLTTLKGCPEEVPGTFACNSNKLTSLEYGPLSVGGSYRCKNNLLTSFKGCPSHIHGLFSCGKNKFKNLKYFPTIIEKDLYFQQDDVIFTKEALMAHCNIEGDIIF